MIPFFLKKDDKYIQLIEGEEIESPTLAYVIGEDGIYALNQNVGHNIVKKAKTIFGCSKVEEEITHSYPVVNYETYHRVVTFFRAVYDKHKSEANVLLVLNRQSPPKEQEYKVVIPKQTVSSAHVSYDVTEIELETGEYIAGSIHSHPNFSAHQSGTDHKDEAEGFDGLHITLGYIEKDIPDMHQRVVLAGGVYDPTNTMIEMTKREAGSVEEDWMNKVEEKPASTTVYSYNSEDHWSEGWPTRQNNSRKEYGSRKGNWNDTQVFNSMKPSNITNQCNSKKLLPIVRAI